MVPLIAAGLIAGAGSLIGGAASSVFGSKSNAAAVRDTNATNLQIAKDNNAFNQQMWEKNNAYNDPSAQRDRLLKAGINPYLGDNVGNVESKSITGTMPAPMQAPQPGNGLIQAAPYISNFATQLMNQQLMAAQVKTADATATSSIAKAELDKAAAQKMLGVDTESVHMDIQNKAYQGRLLSLQSDAQEIQNRVNDVFASPLAKANLAKIQSDVASMLVNRKLTSAQVATEVQRAINVSARTNKINLESKQISTLLPYLVTQYQLSNQGQSNANILSGNEVKFQNSTTMPDNTFGMRSKVAGLEQSENAVQLGGLNIDKATAETYKITQESKLVKKDNDFYILNTVGKLIPLSILIK